MAAPPQPVAQLCSIAGLDDVAQRLLQDGAGPREYVDALVQAGRLADAVRFIAHALPKRESVWWAWVSARRAVEGDAPPPVKAALEATEKWIAQPNEENRRAAMSAAEAAGPETPAGCAAFAAFLSGPSLAPPDVQAVPPGPYDTAKAVAGAVTLAAVAVPAKAAENLRASVQQGLDVTARIKLW